MTHEKNMKSARELYFEVCEEIRNGHDAIEAYEGYFEALDFLYQQPQIGDFVPTNEKGEVMGRLPFRLPRHKDKPPDKVTEDYRDKYQQAQSRVLWQGWEWIKYSDTASMYALKHKSCSKVIATKNRGGVIFHHDNKTYNDLITSGVKLERIEKK